MNLRNQTIEHKLTVIVAVATAVAVVIASSILISRHAVTTRTQAIDDLHTIADIVANNSKAALSFADAEDANEVLRGLADKPTMLAACLYNAQGAILASYRSPLLPESFAFPSPGTAGHAESDKDIRLFRPIDQNGEHLGTLFLYTDRTPLTLTLRRHIVLAVLITLGSILLATFVASRLQRIVLGPINGIVKMAHAVAAGDLPEAIDVTRLDEVGRLQQSFNQIVDKARDVVHQAQTIARGDYSITIDPRSDKDELSHALIKMTEALRSYHEESERQNWLKNALSELNNRVRGEQDLNSLNHEILSSLAGHLNAQIGAIFLTGDHHVLRYAAGYAQRGGARCESEFKFGQGLVGQAAEGRRMLFMRPPFQEPGLVISTGFAEFTPAELALVPLVREHEVIGVLEIGAVTPFTADHKELLRLAAETAAIAIHAAISRQRLNELLGRTQEQSRELQHQQGVLQSQNIELEERNVLLEQQQQEIHRKNKELEGARLDLERKARELELASQYKSEFLANVSHELRTPLNSLLILSRLLGENKEGNLLPKQIEFARTIHKSGSDLLALINDILDLSKVEAGKMEFTIEDVDVQDICSNLESTFRHIAEQKGLAFFIILEPEAPRHLRTDSHRMGQILRNLLSNAFKFTHQGSVTVRIYHPPRDEFAPPGESTIAFAVRDSGIGIPKDKQALIFNAFTQADGTTSREYGGTGLGLSISRELALRLGGDIRIQSDESQGSTFTLYLPAEAGSTVATIPPPPETPKPALPALPTRASRLPILAVEDDAGFVDTLRAAADKGGFDLHAVSRGRDAVAEAMRTHPIGILLDVMLPDIDGHEVLRCLKEEPATRHIPVFVISALEKDPQFTREGAVGFLTKPVTLDELNLAFHRLETIAAERRKRLLIVEDDVQQANVMRSLLDNDEVDVTIVHTGRGALEEIQRNPFDCIILDLGLTDMSGFTLLDDITAERNGVYTPIIIHTGRDLSRDEESRIRRKAESIIIKGEHSAERLLDRATLFLHLRATDEGQSPPPAPVATEPPVETAPPAKVSVPAVVGTPRTASPGDLKGRRVLIVDDDMRNAYSLCAVLDSEGMDTLLASDGRKALAQLDANPRVDAVLMDIMMPGMDGYETMREIRKQPRFAALPIIALTARAMTGDREKCIEAGATEYLPKPVDVDKLTSTLRDVMKVQA